MGTPVAELAMMQTVAPRPNASTVPAAPIRMRQFADRSAVARSVAKTAQVRNAYRQVSDAAMLMQIART
jgi:hypothetical protein